MPIPLRSLLLLLLSVVVTAGETVHEILPQYGLPVGLVPDSVKSYSLTANGDFEVDLQSPCYVHFGGDLVYYEKTIKGKLSYGSISDLRGIKAKKLFLWVSVDGIVAHPADSTVEFKVGFLSESLPWKEFDRIPTCKAKASCRGFGGVLEDLIPIAERLFRV